MASESTPLLTTVRVGRVRRRYPHNVLRRFCTIALSCSLLCLLLVFLITVISDPSARHHDDYGWHWPGCGTRKVSHQRLTEILRDTPSSEKAEQWSRYYTAGPHLAGQNYSQAVWTKERWEEWGIKSEIVAYDVYLNRPLGHRLALLEKSKDKNASSSSEWKVAFEASLAEDALQEDPTSRLKDRIPTFHGYSASGNVTAPFVYVNYGTYQDFEDLVKANVSLKGKIAIARYGGIFRGLKVKRAQELGVLGVLLYSDPGDDEVKAEDGYEAYPKGPARNPSSVQRGSVEFLSVAPGDPTTPGYPSKPGVPRQPVDEAIPRIPSIPISYADALPILKALNGRGPKAKDLNKYWNKNLGLEYKGVEYNIGPTPDDVVLNLNNEQEYITTPIWNVIGIINGSIPHEVIVAGNHRDAWIAGGAGDPNSGSAVLNEVIRGYGKAVEEGWKPLRTIVFGSWDGEEYSLLGSTEWVEEYLTWLSGANVAYVNVDVGVRGTRFGASADPKLNKVIYDVTSAVQSPNQTVEGQTVGDLWDGAISTIGSGSDFTAFQDFAGVPCIDFGFGATQGGDPVYHYHSNYDSFYWMSRFGDPGFRYHRTMSQVLGLVVAKLAEEPVIAFNASDYANALDGYIDKVEEKFDSARLSADAELAEPEIDMLDARASVRGGQGRVNIDRQSFDAILAALRRAAANFKGAANGLDQRAAHYARRAEEHIPWWKWWKKVRLVHQIAKINYKYKTVERAFLYKDGLDGRPWFKHVVFAPGLWTGYAGAVFPGLVESIDADDFPNTVRWAKIIEQCIVDATKVLS